jgi:nucleoside phosphorylase
MSRIYVFTAMKIEAESILEVVRGKETGQIHARNVSFHTGSNDLHLIFSGMGPQKAKESATDALRPWLQNSGRSVDVPHEKPDFALVTGLCGGLTQHVRECDLVVYENCVSGEMKLTCSASRQITELLTGHGIAYRLADGITSPRIATNRAEREALSRSAIAVVDTETYEILSLAARAGIPTAVLRVVSDSIDRDLPNFNQALNAQGDLDGRKALGIALGSPLRTLRLMAANKRALRQLTQALRVVLKADWPMINQACGA